ncbi:hypothetical protein [Candidatus Paracaedibacter symbiosus]|uniref:hypothetical protein n=1 Tax=Candidatus Paracaedibacter symbiosus TaxID=244582 RepID=UPI000509A94B|nr:hypothetical protein [Candidatus Paracaedibacter symbiosus]
MIYKIITIAMIALSLNAPAEAFSLGSIFNRNDSSNSSGGGGFNLVSFTASLGSAISNGAKDQICKQGGVCRKFEGIPCEFSKDLVSSCAIICGDRPDFIASTCIRKSQNKWGLNTQTWTYRDGEHVSVHLKRQLEKGRFGNNPAQIKFFDSFCSLKGTSLVLPLFKQDIQEGCRTFKGGGNVRPNQQQGSGQGISYSAQPRVAPNRAQSFPQNSPQQRGQSAYPNQGQFAQPINNRLPEQNVRPMNNRTIINHNPGVSSQILQQQRQNLKPVQNSRLYDEVPNYRNQNQQQMRPMNNRIAPQNQGGSPQPRQNLKPAQNSRLYDEVPDYPNYKNQPQEDTYADQSDDNQNQSYNHEDMYAGQGDDSEKDQYSAQDPYSSHDQNDDHSSDHDDSTQGVGDEEDHSYQQGEEADAYNGYENYEIPEEDQEAY